MFSGHFYHATTRKVVSVFGTLFNNISVVRKDSSGRVVNITRVPLAYGPKQKFLARLDEQPNLDAPKVAIKLPRMSFEIISLTYDVTTKTNRNNILTAPSTTDTGAQAYVRNYAPYRMGIQLSIMAKNQDDALQCLEQILPHFQPEYTVTIKDLESMAISTDMPFVLTGVQMNEDYEGDFMQRRAIIYTLDFETRLRFYGPVSKRAVIKTAGIGLYPGDIGEKITVQVDPPTAGPNDNYTVTTAIDFIDSTQQYNLHLTAESGLFIAGETVTDTNTGATARVTGLAGNVLSVNYADGVFHNGNTLTGAQSHVTRTIALVEAIPHISLLP
jgi:hypothetical protein